MREQDLILRISQFLREIIQDENVDLLKLVESFKKGIYVNTKYGKIKTILNFQISDEEFLFTVNINKDEYGNIVMFNIKKDDL